MLEAMIATMLPGVDLNAFAADLKKFIATAEEMNERTKRIEMKLADIERRQCESAFTDNGPEVM